MAPWAGIVARVVLGALKRWAPEAVGAAIKALAAIELVELASDAYRAIFGGEERQARAIEGYQSGDAPPETVDYMRRELALQSAGESRDAIDEEEVLRELARASRAEDEADFTVRILQ